MRIFNLATPSLLRSRCRSNPVVVLLLSLAAASVATQVTQIVRLADGATKMEVFWWLLNLGFGCLVITAARLTKQGRPKLAGWVLTLWLSGVAAALVLIDGLSNPIWGLTLGLASGVASRLISRRVGLGVAALSGLATVAIASATYFEWVTPASTSANTGISTAIATAALLLALAGALVRQSPLPHPDHTDSAAPLSPTTESGDPRLSRLSRREREVAGLVAEGLANKQIASQLKISVRTVQDHVSSSLRKTETANRTALGVLVIQNRAAAPEEPRQSSDG